MVKRDLLINIQNNFVNLNVVCNFANNKQSETK